MNVGYFYLYILTRRNDLRTESPEETLAIASSTKDNDTMIKSNMFQPS